MSDTYPINLGQPFPLGASLTPQGVNFAVVSEDAQKLYLCLFDDADNELHRLPFIAKQRGIWHMEVVGLQAGQRYGLRAEGPFAPQEMQVFNVHKLLIDPYAKVLSEKLTWHEDQAALSAAGEMNTQDSAFCVPKSIVQAVEPPAQRPPRVKVNAAQRVLYELHVKSFSQQMPIAEHLKGTYLGVISDAGIEHLQQLGVTTIQLMPCFSFAHERHLQALNLHNHWGYNPISFFAVEPSYAHQDATSEFQQMVDGLRAAGFEVILDVVYNHTAESDLDQSSVCYRGLDNRHYYRHQDGRYLNYTGCGNCVDTYNPASIRLICDSMRYWVEVMGVDGFRFDLGVDLGRTDHDFSAKAPLLQAILQDPILSNTCLVMEPWDIGPNGYQVGQFPRGFLECNDQYRDTMRRFWRGDEGLVPQFATRLMGSRDYFHKGHRSALHSVNYITYHDGYTLNDLVSYHRRHNLANMENNRDGHGDNISQNFGVEGATDHPDIQHKRLNQQICFLATLLLSQGTPHILGGDELSHSQQGNNNAYCQDNEITWFNWQQSDARNALQETIAKLIKLRQEHPILAEIHLQDDALYQFKSADQVAWYNEQGLPMSDDDWNEGERDYLALTLHSADHCSRLWLVFYREDIPLKAFPPCPISQLQVLFHTQGMQLQDDHLNCQYRGVMVAQY